jgi:hypothetical protein
MVENTKEHKAAASEEREEELKGAPLGPAAGTGRSRDSIRFWARASLSSREESRTSLGV